MKVRALQTVTLGPGTVLTLSDRQAARRGHQLAAEGSHRYRATTEVCFKVGEEFGVDASLPKALACAIETDEPPVKRGPDGKLAGAGKRAAAAQGMVAAPPSPTLVDPARLDIR